MAKQIAAIVTAGLGIFALILTLILLAIGNNMHYPYLPMEDGWRLRGAIVNSEGENVHYETESISVDELPRGNRGDYIQISQLLPDMGDIPFPTLLMETRYSALEISVDSTVVYRYDLDAVGTGRFVGSTFHLISLPEEYAGQYVTITIYRTEDHAGKAISSVYIGAHEDMEAMLLHKDFFSINCGFFLVIFGLSLLFLTLLYLNRVPELLPQMVSSVLCAMLGTLLITNEHVSFLFINADIGTVMDYISIYMILPLCYILVEVILPEYAVSEKVYRFMRNFSIVFILLIFLLHFTNILHMNRVLLYYYVIAGAGAVIVGIDIFRSLKGTQLATVSKVTLIGMASLIVCLLLNMLCFALWRAGVPFLTRMTGRNFLPLGSMLFAASQLINYLSFITESGSRQKDYAALQSIAYADALTGLANRARADKVFEELDRSREDYCLVSVDVNGLKDTNDRLGHAAGDQLLKDYATALKANFGDEALCARMGGDEFLVVMKKTNADGFGVRLRRLYSDLDEMNEKDRTIFRSAAIGYAFRHECHGGDAHKVYLLADERMFENKREQHIRLRIKDRS
ncbi:MAG: GGDEF domain-containing protein [Lachnospiraceae bacterium]|nr:GGDEF domain-containing protein [Lachnospiraceae bacterium]